MAFPVYFDLLGLHLHPHPVMEVIAYTGGSQFYFFLRRRAKKHSPPVPIEANLWILIGCLFGALFGAKLLAALESFAEVRAQVAQGHYEAIIGGKTIVGGLLGGWIGVEIAKRVMNVRRSTGDLFVFPLCLGIAIGRVGCFLTGLADHTAGVATSLPWGVDFGDGIRRHPTQTYEILFLLTLAGVLALGKRRPCLQASGGLFRMFLASYLLFRLLVDFIKPSDKPVLGMSAIQIACAIGAAVCIFQLTRSCEAKTRMSE